MGIPQEIAKINVLGREWYDSDTIRTTELGKQWYKSRNTTKFTFVRKFRLTQGKDFVYTDFADVTNVKEVHNKNSDRVLLSCEWVEQRMLQPSSVSVESPKLANKRARIDSDDRLGAAQIENGEATSAEELTDLSSLSSSSPSPEFALNQVAQLLPGIPLPDHVTRAMLPTIELDEDAMFLDGSQKALQISICGVRHPDFIYFRGPDVAKFMNVRLELSARHFAKPTDYIDVYEGSRPVGYLRYLGLIRYLFSLRAGAAQLFQTWAARTLFLIQFRPAHSVDIVGTPQSLCQPFLRTSAGGIAGVYVCWLQSVDILSKFFHIPCKHSQGDDRGVYRIGLTSNLLRELTELRSRYTAHTRGAVSELHVAIFESIDPALFRVVERDLSLIQRKMLQDKDIFRPFPGGDDLVVLHESNLTELRGELLRLHTEYGAGVAEHSRALTTQELKAAHRIELEESTAKLQNELLVLQCTHERQLRDLQQQVHELQVRLSHYTGAS